MAVTRIHVNQAVIRSNHKTGSNAPVLTVKSGRSNRYAHAVEILGPSRVVYAGQGSGRKPLSCGARVWIETDAEVLLTGGTDVRDT
jgi:hypothetical protein